mgnify:CR=1 FL=1
MASSLTSFADYYYADPYYTSSYSNDPASTFAYLVIAVVVLASMWKIFAKAKQPGWAAIVPIYNLYILLKILNRPIWWMLLFFVPLVNLIAGIVLSNDLSKSFGKGVGTTLLLIFLPFIGYPMLGFGDAKYKAIKR